MPDPQTPPPPEPDSCPFCGAKAEVQWESTQGFVSCANEDCYATSTWFASDDASWVRERVVARWNRRVSDSERAQLAARVAELEAQLASMRGGIIPVHTVQSTIVMLLELADSVGRTSIDVEWLREWMASLPLEEGGGSE